jgi:diaminopimelate epimerase
MRFTKMHGTGNDYVYVDLFDETVRDPEALARVVSDRHTGIGADGLILLAPAEAEDADVKMVMYNADGSRAEMCGNGIRCLAALARSHGRTEENPMRVETDAGIKVVEIRKEGARVDMGHPELDPRKIPVDLPGPRVVDAPIEVEGEEFEMTCVSMGNPHTVVFVEDVAAVELAWIGPAFERHALFPQRVNVSFAQVIDPGHVEQRTWERGSGETRACGTGACAVCVAGVLTGRTAPRVRSRFAGGELFLEWDDEGMVFLTGPAVAVFSGVWAGDGV